MGGAMIRLSWEFVSSYIEVIIDKVSSRNIISMTYNFLNSEIGITLGTGPGPKQTNKNWHIWTFLLSFMYFQNCDVKKLMEGLQSLSRRIFFKKNNPSMNVFV